MTTADISQVYPRESIIPSAEWSAIDIDHILKANDSKGRMGAMPNKRSRWIEDKLMAAMSMAPSQRRTNMCVAPAVLCFWLSLSSMSSICRRLILDVFHLDCTSVIRVGSNAYIVENTYTTSPYYTTSTPWPQRYQNYLPLKSLPNSQVFHISSSTACCSVSPNRLEGGIA